MAQPKNKQSFVHGAALLAVAAVVVKLIGFFYKVPLQAVIGEAGYGYFMTAYDAYSVLLVIATAGLPVAMSKMIGQASALGQNNQVRRIYKTAGAIFLALGIAGSLVLMLGNQWLANMLKQPNAAMAIFCLGPCTLFMGLVSTFRGFFQGHGNMKPTSVSQVLEALIKTTVGLGLAVFVMWRWGSVPMAAAAAILGVTCSCAVSSVFLYSRFRSARRALVGSGDAPLSFGTTAKGLIAIALPISIGSAGLQLLTLLEQRIYMSQLLGGLGYSQAVADSTKGIYSMTMTMYNMPCSLIVPIAISVIPAISSALALKDYDTVKSTEESAARVAGLISIPCSVGMGLLARPIMSLLSMGRFTGESLTLATRLLQILSLCVFLYAIIQYTNALLQSHGFAHVPVIHMLSAGAVKLVVVWLLTGNPNLGILGAPMAAVLCYSTIAALNLIAIRRKVPQKPALFSNLIRPVLPAAIMAVAVAGVYMGMSQFLDVETGSKLVSAVLCFVPVAVGVLVYFVAVVLLKTIKKEDCLLLPKGEKLAKLLKLQ